MGYKILFVNPRSPRVFQDLARDMAARWSPSLIWTEVSGIVQFQEDEHLKVKKIPRFACYNRRTVLTRFFSVAGYFIYIFVKILFSSRRSLLFMVTTPPFMGLIGFFFKKIRKQKYVMLVYDIQPDVWISAGIIKNSPLLSLWKRINTLVLNHADAVITIGEYMAEKLSKQFDPAGTTYGKIAIIHNWADCESIKPLAKRDNPFIREHGLEGKCIVLYSGNIGATHDTETLTKAAIKLKDYTDIVFVIIGEGAKKHDIVEAKAKYGLDNMIVMSYLPQSQIQYSFPSADISLVTISKGVEGYLVPCKFYSYLAAGSAVVAICDPRCEVADIISNEKCGNVIALGDAVALSESILHYYNNKGALELTKTNSRNAAVQKYSRRNTQLYVNVIEKIFSNKSEPTIPHS